MREQMCLQVTSLLRRELFVAFICIHCSNALISSSPSKSFQRFRILDSYWSTQGYLKEVSTISAIKCSTECIGELECMSFFYDTVNQMCQLHRFNYETRTSFTTRPSTQYFRMQNVSIPSNYTCTDAPPDPAYNTEVMSDGTLFRYRIGWDNVTQYDAQAICQSEGGALIRILSVEKMETIGSILTSCNGYMYEFWTDGTNINAPDRYNITQWVTALGEPLPSSPSLDAFWYPDEPFDPNYENCVAIYGGTNDINLWVSWPCHNLYMYICEK